MITGGESDSGAGITCEMCQIEISLCLFQALNATLSGGAVNLDSNPMSQYTNGLYP